MLIEMGQLGDRTPQKNAASRFLSADNQSKTTSDRTNLVEVLLELRNLLDDYSPAWYTEEHQRKLECALQSTNF